MVIERNKRQIYLFIDFGTRKLMIVRFSNDFISEERWICIFNKVRFNTFYAFMEVVPIVANFKQPFFYLSKI